jgi:hypothetical protein
MGELREQQEHEQPSTLDIVKIDGRWAQVHSRSDTAALVYLDDGSEDHIEWADYELTRLIRSHVLPLKDQFTPEEIARIRWGAEQEQNPHLVYEVAVFGEYRKR